jgi:hypothetical protein
LSTFDRLDRADDWLALVTSSVRHRVMRAGQRAWNSPENRVPRERAARMSQRAHDRREAEVTRLAGSSPVAERVVRTHLRDRSEDRVDRILARAAQSRDSRPLGRATR